MTLKQEVTAHYIRHWGVPLRPHLEEPCSRELAVFEFAPGRQFHSQPPLQTSRFATNGMSACVQSYQGRLGRTEIYASARSSAPWVLELLVAVANYPQTFETLLEQFDTIPIDGPIDQDRSPFTALLLGPPEPEDPDTLGVIVGVTPEPVLVHRVVGITPSEYKFALNYKHGEELWGRLVSLGQPLLIDQPRPEAVAKTQWLPFRSRPRWKQAGGNFR
jgi:hypothetical protein